MGYLVDLRAFAADRIHRSVTTVPGGAFQRRFLERGIIFNKMGNKIVADYEEAFI